MTPALPPEVRAFLTLALKRHDAGCRRFLSAKTLSGICGFDQGDLNAVAEWCEKRSLLTVPKVGARYRHWRKATLDWDRARALLGGGR
jgi:hypothetical protein